MKEQFWLKTTGCILAKDEENTLGACITNLATVADEMIVIGNGSSDNTIEVATVVFLQRTDSIV